VIHGAELDAVHSIDRIRAGIHRATHTGPGCSFDPLRAGTRCSSLDGSAAGRGFGVIIDSWPGWSFIERSTHNRRFCNRGTSCNKTPPVLQSRYIERHTPGRVAVAIRCGPWFRCDPWGRDSMQFTRWIRCGPWFRCDPWGRARCRSLDGSDPGRGCNCAPCFYLLTQEFNPSQTLRVSDSKRRAGLQLRSAAGRARCRSLDGSAAGRGFGVIHGAELDAGHSMDPLRAVVSV